MPKFTRKLYKKAEILHIWKIQVLFSRFRFCFIIFPAIVNANHFWCEKKKTCGVQNHTTTLHSTDRNGSYQQLQGILTSSVNQSHSSQHPPPFDSFFLEMTFWLVVSTHLKNISQLGNLPQIGVKIKNS